MPSQINIEKIVEKPTWKQILLELIEQNKIDPWDVDIILIADSFMKRVREMKQLDLTIQANVILAAAILLKYKSEYLRYLTMEEQTLITDYSTEMPLPGEVEEIPQLTLVSRIPPKRQITLDELVEEMERVMKYDSEERRKIPRGGITETMDFMIAEWDVEKKINDVLERIRANTDETGWSLFSSLIKGVDNLEIVRTLVSVLHLTQNGTIDIKQERIFGEILIHLLEDRKEKEEMVVRT